VIDGDELPDNITIHDNHSIPSISSDIFMLYKLSAEMRERRYTSGSLTLNSVKLNFQLDENGEPTSVFKFKSKEANRLVEEFMLLANISVAKKIASAYPDEALLRKHEEPLPRRLVGFLYIPLLMYHFN
jgi:protein SSD1